jgi:hypothetical protein
MLVAMIRWMFMCYFLELRGCCDIAYPWFAYSCLSTAYRWFACTHMLCYDNVHFSGCVCVCYACERDSQACICCAAGQKPNAKSSVVDQG